MACLNDKTLSLIILLLIKKQNMKKTATKRIRFTV